MKILLSRLGLCAVLAIGTVTTCAVGPDPLRVLLVTGGHDQLAYENASYRRLVAQSIRWAAGR